MDVKINRLFVEKPWGAEDWLVKTKHYVAKHLYINPNEQISLQYHNEKHETMMVLEGMGKLLLGKDGKAEDFVTTDYSCTSSTITVGDIFSIPPKTIHQIKAITGLKILEISTSQVKDLVRVGEDKYGRN